jgi:lactoylglutathione lyase
MDPLPQEDEPAFRRFHARLNLLVLRTPRVEETVKFYSALGEKFTRERHGDGPEHYAADLEGMVFEIYPATSGAPSDTTSLLGFWVDNLYDVLDRLGLEIEPDLTERGQEVVLRDPDGRKVVLSS